VRIERLARIVGRSLAADAPLVAPAGMRERTLAFVAEVGRPRSRPVEATPLLAVAGSVPGPAATAETARATRTPFRGDDAAPRERARRVPVPLRSILALAAVIVLAVAGTGLVVRTLDAAQASRQDQDIEALADVASWSLRVATQPDARHIALVPTAGSGTGTLVFSPSSREVVVVMTGIAEPPAGREYRCWVRVDGQNQRIGRMFFGGGLGYWVGPVDAVATAGPGSQFGVTLVDIATGQAIGDPVLTGTLES
jgi:hypothetical protein